MSIYSTLLWQGEAATTQETVYTVPDGTVAVLRDVEVYNASGATIAFHITTSASGFGNAVVAAMGSVANSAGGQWQGRVVLPAGGSFAIPGYAAGVYVHVSGYQLA